MKKVIVCTTINPPTEAIEKFSQKKDWELFIVGDLKTPKDAYQNSGLNLRYLSPEMQEKKYPEYSNILGWNCSTRRNLGIIEACNQGAELIALVDDDNIPAENWGKDIYINQEIEVDLFENKEDIVVDPVYISSYYDHITKTSHSIDNPAPNCIWHRGFPLDKITNRYKTEYRGKVKVTPLVQANLWNGDPDIDAILRLQHNHEIEFKSTNYFTTSNISPFNSQNTILHRSVASYYKLLPGVGRVEDIWGAYLMQLKLKDKMKSPYIIYGPATVYQKRNEHNLLKDFNEEIFGYSNTTKLLNGENVLPEKTVESYNIYRNIFNLD